jgi:threonine/homoserine efflux transporter RhtA
VNPLKDNQGVSGINFVMAILALLGLIATGFVSIRTEIKDLTGAVYGLKADVMWLKKDCCGEIGHGEKIEQSRTGGP